MTHVSRARRSVVELRSQQPKVSTSQRHVRRLDVFERVVAQKKNRPPPILCVPSTDVARSAAGVLGRAITKIEASAVLAAHRIGIGELGRDGEPASLGNFTQDQLRRKYRLLQAGGFDARAIRALMRAGVAGAAHVDAAHWSIAADLYQGRVIEAHPFNANGNQTKIYWVKLFNDATQRTREALFKPRTPGDNEGWGRQPMEYVAYAINRMLGMDYVPPVAYRRNIGVDFNHFAEGAMLYMVPDAHLLAKVPGGDWGTDRALFLSDARILDILIHNPDRQRGNYLRGKHWVDGTYKPMLIDHAAGFRPKTIIDLGQNDSFNGGPVKVVRRSTFEALKHLNFDWLKRELGEFISDHEIRALLHRRDGIVGHFEHHGRVVD